MFLFKSLLFFLSVNSYLLFAHSADDLQQSTKKSCIEVGSKFEDVVSSKCFVDKSLFIKKFFDINLHVFLITTPSHFGKSTNMEMLKTFLSNEDEKRSGICFGIYKWLCKFFLTEPHLTPGCKLFSYNSLNIYKLENGTFFKENCGKYPVIHVNFKGATGSSFYEIFDKFKVVLRKAFKEHTYLLKSSLLNIEETTIFTQYTNSKLFKKISEIQVTESLKYLSEMLYKHFKKSVILLIDDFDAPIWSAIGKHFPRNEVERTNYLVNDLISTTLKTNDNIAKVLINACTRFSGVLPMNSINPEHFPFLGCHGLTQFYGLTKKEVRGLLEKIDLRGMFYPLSDYYNGYKTGTGSRMFSPWSLFHYIKYGILDDYWVDRAEIKHLDEIFLQPEVRKLLLKLLNKETILTELNHQALIWKTMIFKDVIACNRTCNALYATKFLDLLFSCGYLNPTHVNPKQISLKIPNKEIYHHLYTAVYSKLYFQKNFNFNSSKIKIFLEALDKLGSFVNKKKSLMNFAKSVNELYGNDTLLGDHNTLLGSIYCFIKNSDKFNLTKIEAGKNINGAIEYAYTVTLRGDEEPGTAIILGTRNDRKSAEEALKQLVDKHYYKMLQLLGKYILSGRKDRIYVVVYLAKKGTAGACYMVNTEQLDEIICV